MHDGKLIPGAWGGSAGERELEEYKGIVTEGAKIFQIEQYEYDMGGPSMYYVNKLLIKSQGGKRVRFLIRHTFPLTRGLCQAAHT